MAVEGSNTLVWTLLELGDGTFVSGDSAGHVTRWDAVMVRSEVNIELKFPPKLLGARSRLYRRRFLQVNARWKARAEIYTMHSFAPFSNLNFFVKNRQNFFAIELMNIH